MHVPNGQDGVRVPGGPPGTVLVAARRRLAERAAARIGDGLEPAPCHSRVLETALALRLEELTGQYRARAAYARFLRQRRITEPVGTLDHTFADCALTASPLPSALVNSALRGFDHFSSGRKRLLLRAIAVMFGTPLKGVTPVERTGLHPWASAVLTASEVIIAGHARPDQRRELLAALDHPGIWDGHVLCHLLCAHAVRNLPGTDDVVSSAIRRAAAVVQADGGVPFIERLDIFCGAVAGLGLLPTYHGFPVAHRLALRIAELQGPHGGWGYATGVDQPDVDTTSVSLELLVSADPVRFREQIARGRTYLREIRGADGGFPTYLRGAQPEVAMSAAAVHAFSGEDASVLSEAAAFIVRGQRPDGTFEPGWSRSNANTQCRVLLALKHSEPVLSGLPRRRCQAAAARSARRLLRDQNADGGWGQLPDEPSDPISTSFALIGLAGRSEAGSAVASGVRHLLACQREDGGFDSRPDSTGPRGFVYDVPVLAELYPLLALGHLTGFAAAVRTA